MPPTVLITRPEPYGAEFAAALQDLPGEALPVILSPALVIEGRGALPDLAPYRWLIFTSRNGVRRYAELSARRDIPAYAVGDATAEEARRIGLRAVSAQGDARDLIARIKADGKPGPMLHLRGEHAAADLARALLAVGITADQAIIYAQTPAPLSDAARAALASDAPVIAPLFSPRSAAALFDGATPAAPVVALAISAAAAARVPDGAVREMLVAERPDAGAMLRAWPEAVSAAYRLEGTKRAQ
ncbi:uroporphyrinogen-III synthase [Roseovarius nanhaiticus]|uniref:Uroporphyrinogen-III synthase n=1 Tax=Roseovarius nanhaiticus TaxID=573024 RepID=A0A1N7F7L9_9RHOB|nr:uroporphyrinogen-III synthase [Roseovarius nanhaiticus]SEK60013.1 uroporphyrinogen-III synthase [Roseovarius nanhaiticus]SIR96341.1 uroporphyrinogen-III synthase [Roseovarius nanhaiticus]